MKRSVVLRLTFAFFALAMAVQPISAAEAATDIGVAAAVNPEATGTPPDAAPRIIQVGLDMVQNEHVVTGAKGRTQFLFLDGSALTLGPDSDIVLDEFVYDPKTQDGSLVFSATKGVFRLVGGKISKRTPIVFKTASGRVAVRGGIAILKVGPTGLVANFLFGDRMDVTNGGVTKTARRPGFKIETEGTDAPPSDPAPIPAEAISGDLGSLEGVAGSSGGAPEQPTDEIVAGTQISELGSAAEPVAVQAAQAGAAPAVAEASTVAEDSAQINESTQDAAQTASLSDTTLSPEFTFGGRYLRQVPFSAFDFNDATTTVIPANNQGYVNGRIDKNELVVMLAGNRTIRLPAETGDFTFGPIGMDSLAGRLSGEGFVSPDGDFFFYNLREADNGDNPSALFGGTPNSAPSAPFLRRAYTLFPGFPGNHDVPFLPVGAGGDFPTNDFRPLYWSLAADNVGNPNEASTMGWATVIVDGRGASQRSLSLGSAASFFTDDDGDLIFGGFVYASVRTSATGLPIRVGNGNTASKDANGNAFFGTGDEGTQFFVVDSDFVDLTGVRQDAAGFAQPFEDTAQSNEFFQSQYAVRTALPSGVGDSRSSRTLSGYTAGLVELRRFNGPVQQFFTYVFNSATAGASGVSLTTDAVNNRVFADFAIRDVTGTEARIDLFWGNPVGAIRSTGAFIDDQIIVMRRRIGNGVPGSGGALNNGMVVRSRGAVVTEHFYTDRSAVPDSVSFCACDFLTWGFWHSDFLGFGGDRSRTHVAPWMAGDLPGAGDIQTAGTASFSGHAVANIRNGNTKYIDFGNFALSWNFGTRTGTATISDLDGATYQAGVASANGREWAGNLARVGGMQNRTGTIDASFFRNGGDPSAGTGGEFQLSETSGAPYRVGGIVLGVKQ